MNAVILPFENSQIPASPENLERLRADKRDCELAILESLEDRAEVERLSARFQTISVQISDMERELRDAAREVHDMPAIQPSAWRDIDDKGRPLNTIPNVRQLLAHYGIKVHYDIIRKARVIEVPRMALGDAEAGESALSTVESLAARNGLPEYKINSYLTAIGDANRYNEVAEFINSKPWDGVSRFDELMASVTLRDDFPADFAALLVRRWMISAVAAAVTAKGFWSKGVLVLQGEQSLGKTSWLRSLVPHGSADLFMEGATLDVESKDSKLAVISRWIVELGELDGSLRKSDMAALKGFISSGTDSVRRPYARAESTYQRRTVFCASVNPEQFLVDETGNVRWWTIPVVGLNAGHGIDVQQLWAEVASWQAAGERHWLDREEEARLESFNAGHQQADPIDEALATGFDWSCNAPLMKRMTATEALRAVGFPQPTRAQLNRAGSVLRRLTGKEPIKNNKAKVFVLPDLLEPAVRQF